VSDSSVSLSETLESSLPPAPEPVTAKVPAIILEKLSQRDEQAEEEIPSGV
jgi:hypothetical protein